MKTGLKIIFFQFIASTLLYGQKLDNIQLDNKLSILNDRAFFNFPTQAKNEKRSVDMMSADPNGNEETRIVFDNGNMRLVFFAQELFTLTDNALFQTVTKQGEKNKLTTKVLTDKDSLLSILSSPTKFDKTQNAILINSLIVKTPDNTLFRISAYINPEAYKQIKDYQKLTEAVFSTLTKGTRKNNRSARQEVFEIFGTKKSLTFNLPEDYCVTVDQQYDFQVFKLHRYQTFTDEDWVQVIIYNGHHPSLVYKDYGLSENDGKKATGKFLDENIDWLLFDISQQNFYDKEQKIICDKVEKGLIFHVAMLSNKKELTDELTRIVENISLTK